MLSVRPVSWQCTCVHRQVERRQSAVVQTSVSCCHGLAVQSSRELGWVQCETMAPRSLCAPTRSPHRWTDPVSQTISLCSALSSFYSTAVKATQYIHDELWKQQLLNRCVFTAGGIPVDCVQNHIDKEVRCPNLAVQQQWKIDRQMIVQGPVKSACTYLSACGLNSKM